VYVCIVCKELCTVSRARVVCTLIFAVIATAIAPYHVMFIGILVGYHYCAILRNHDRHKATRQWPSYRDMVDYINHRTRS